MPVLLILFLVGLLLVLIVLSFPLSLIQRYRVGTARRPARGWVATINLFAFALSAMLLVGGATITNYWVPRALITTLGGLGAGAILGLAGAALTRWERTPRSIHYTPFRPLVIGIMLVVTVRLIYGFWRGIQVWRIGHDDASWLAAAGAAGSLGAGALVIGYYFFFWAVVRWQFARHRRLTRVGGRL